MLQFLGIFFVRSPEESVLGSSPADGTPRTHIRGRTQWDSTALAILALGVIAYALCRYAVLPPNPATTHSFGHDSAYIAIVAENIRQGRGFVNDAHWLVFLHPERLPMPYHNANPLYPLAVAGFAEFTDDVIRAGYCVSILSHVALFLALLVILGPFVPLIAGRVFLALAVCFFPPIFADSTVMLPDAMATALAFWSLAVVIRMKNIWGAIFAGILIGLAWLTRSSVILILPGIVLLFLLFGTWRSTIRNSLVLGVTALLVASPWLLHNQRVWGKPFRSDSQYYLLQDYQVRISNLEVGDALDHYWHSPDEPPSLSHVLSKESGTLMSYVSSTFSTFLRNMVGSWSGGQIEVAALLMLIAALGVVLVVLHLRREESPDDESHPGRVLFAALCTVDIVLLGFLLRARSLEIRYLSFVSVCFALLIAGAAWMIWRTARESGKLGRFGWGLCLGLCAVFWLWFVPLADYQAFARSFRTNEELEAYWEQAALVRAKTEGSGPVVVGTFPYHFTLATGLPSLSIPSADDDYALEYMKKYKSQFVFLTNDELKFWKPEWKDSDRLPNFIEPEEVEGIDHLFRRKDDQ